MQGSRRVTRRAYSPRCRRSLLTFSASAAHRQNRKSCDFTASSPMARAISPSSSRPTGETNSEREFAREKISWPMAAMRLSKGEIGDVLPAMRAFITELFAALTVKETVRPEWVLCESLLGASLDIDRQRRGSLPVYGPAQDTSIPTYWALTGSRCISARTRRNPPRFWKSRTWTLNAIAGWWIGS